MVKRLRASVLPVSLLLILCCGALWAQSAARLNGIVGDSTGASIGGAQVKLVNTATGVITDTVSNSSGVYVFPFVLPGSYSLSITSPGFAVWSKTI
jgi:hypothetical protein